MTIASESRRRLTRIVAVAALVFAASTCSGDSTGPDGTIAVRLDICVLGDSSLVPKRCPAATVLPLQAVEITATAEPSGRVILDMIEIRATGFISVADTFVPDRPTPGPGVAVDTLFIPGGVGEITFTALARGSGVRGTSQPVSLTVSDAVAPVVSNVTATPSDSIEPGRSVQVTYTARDNAGLRDVIVRMTGAATAAETLHTSTRELTHTTNLLVPTTARYGGSFTVAVEAIDFAGLSDTVTLSPTVVVDLTPPFIVGAAVPGSSDAPFLPGDPFRAVIEASDNHKLAWLGFRVGSPVVFQDSVAVTGTVARDTVEAVVQQSWAGASEVRVFARDSSGRVSQWPTIPITVLDAIRRPTRRVPLFGVSESFITFDRKRQTVYLARAFDIAVLPLATGVPETPIALPVQVLPGTASDLTPSGDSLLIPMGPYSRTVGVVDLTRSTRSVDTVRLTYDPAMGFLMHLRVAANRKALIAVNPAGGTGGLLELDLNTKLVRQRSDAGLGAGSSFPGVIASGDRRRIAVLWTRFCCTGVVGQVYDSDSDTFSTETAPDLTGGAGLVGTADHTGSRYLLDKVLLDRELRRVALFDLPSDPQFPNTAAVSAVTADGQFAYFSQLLSLSLMGIVTKVRLSDGAVVERFMLPHFAVALRVVSDDATLVALARFDSSVMLVDLR